MSRYPVDASIPAVMSNESPGRKKPKNSPVSTKIIAAMPTTPPHWIKAVGSKYDNIDVNGLLELLATARTNNNTGKPNHGSLRKLCRSWLSDSCLSITLRIYVKVMFLKILYSSWVKTREQNDGSRANDRFSVVWLSIPVPQHGHCRGHLVGIKIVDSPSI